MNIFFKTENKGFTLVETLVAVAIFATSITALISITARGINNNIFVKNKLIASYLSQEGVELVRNMRDSAVLPENSVPWDVFLSDTENWIGECYSSTVQGSNACYIDGVTSELSAFECIDGVCPVLGFDQQSSTYSYSVITDSIFTRTITVRPIESGNNQEVLVDSIVEWSQGSNTYRVSYKYNLFNWFDPPPQL